MHTSFAHDMPHKQRAGEGSALVVDGHGIKVILEPNPNKCVWAHTNMSNDLGTL